MRVGASSNPLGFLDLDELFCPFLAKLNPGLSAPVTSYLEFPLAEKPLIPCLRPCLRPCLGPCLGWNSAVVKVF